MDSVDSTLVHYVSYLKDWSPRSFNDLCLRVPKLWPNTAANIVLNGDIFDSINKVSAELAYYDPPYGSSNEKMPPSRVRYASYYHLWTTICNHDKPELFGKASRRVDTSGPVAASAFEDFRRNETGQFVVLEVLARLLKATPCEWIVLSYSFGGGATAKDLGEVIRDNGALIKTMQIDCKKNVMSTMKWTTQWAQKPTAPNTEFLFLIKK